MVRAAARDTLTHTLHQAYVAVGCSPYHRLSDVGAYCYCRNGVFESFKIASLCDMYDVNCAAHNFAGHMVRCCVPQPPRCNHPVPNAMHASRDQGTHMSANLMAAIPNFRVLEVDFEDVPWKDALMTHPPSIVDGEMLVSTRPGWGSDVNEEVVRAHPTKNSPTWHALMGRGQIGSADLPPASRL